MPLEGLSEELAGNEALSGFDDISGLAEGYLASKAGQVEDWREGLGDDLKDDKSLADFKDVGGLAKSYVAAQKLIGERQEGAVKVPGEDATPEEIEAFHVKMGRPDLAEGYDFKSPDLPEGVKWDSGMADMFQKACFDAGISKGHAHAILNAYNEYQFSQIHTAQKEMNKELDVLKDSWGDQFDGRVEMGLRGIESMLDATEAEQFKGLMNSTGLGNNPIMLKLAYRIGKYRLDDGYIMGDGHTGVLGAEAAKAKISEINADKGHAHWNPRSPGHKDALKEMDLLFKTAYRK